MVADFVSGGYNEADGVGEVRMVKQNRAHPWHGVEMGPGAPEVVTCYIEMVPTDTVKYEIDKETGLLKLDRPQLYSNYCPAPYGFIPRTYCGKRVGKNCGDKIGKKGVIGDGDPLDICILVEKPILRGDLLVTARPIGGFRAVDRDQADDKIIAVLDRDPIYKDLKDVSECPANLIDRLHHYFMTYKALPGEGEPHMRIVNVYGAEEAREVVRLASLDYADFLATA